MLTLRLPTTRRPRLQSERLPCCTKPTPTRDIIRRQRLSQVAAARSLNANQKVSAFLNYQLQGFSVERLMRFLTAMDRNIEIVIHQKSRTRKRGRILVIAAWTQPTSLTADRRMGFTEDSVEHIPFAIDSKQRVSLRMRLTWPPNRQILPTRTDLRGSSDCG
jgi:hypothetical protein